MALAPTGELVAAARAASTGIAALNVITLEHAEAVVEAAEARGSAVILQISQNAVRYHGGRLQPLAASCLALARKAGVAVALHLDHVEDEALWRAAADAGFSSVMVDAGALPFADNVAVTRAAADHLHTLGLWVEAELGYIGGKPDQPQSAHAKGVRTDPQEADEFVLATGVDGLAVAVGSSHAMTTRTASLDLELISALAARVPVPLVLHGSSGVPDDSLRAAVRAGMTKINVGTALNTAMTEAVREALRDRDLVDPRRYLTAGRRAMVAAAGSVLDVVSPQRR
jgi:fructose-bisphosphate aldolase class II